MEQETPPSYFGPSMKLITNIHAHNATVVVMTLMLLCVIVATLFVMKKQYDRQMLQEMDSFYYVNSRRGYQSFIGVPNITF